MSERARSVAVVAVGDELLEGDHPDTNSSEIARAVLAVGREAQRFLVFRDDEELLARELVLLCREHGTVIVTGGLGPTLDDVTRHAAARAAGVPLVTSEKALGWIRDWFARSSRPMAASNERQALVPRGAALIPNPRGTAPGFRVDVGGSAVFALPGPPREMRGMLEESVLPWLAARPVDAWSRSARSFFLFDLAESAFADRVGAWMERSANPLITVTAKMGVLSVRMVASGSSAAAADAVLAARAAEFRTRFAEHLFSEESGELAFALGRELLARGVSVTLAESCTGGMVAAALTRCAGISSVFRQGYVTYADEAKTALLGVPRELLARFGAVSREVAEAMARGAAERACARLALAVTGIAGPSGGTSEKPVGLVCFATALDGAVESIERRFSPVGRDPVREWATNLALGLGWTRVVGARRA
jgi:nicotinamide-nucleotide amidase